MSNTHAIPSLFLCLLILGTASAAAQDHEPRTDITVWLGSHYTSFDDYSHKVGEYNVGSNEWMPDGSFKLLHHGNGRLFDAFASFYDRRNMDGNLGLNLGDIVAFRATYRSLVQRPGQDKLANLSAREYFGTNDAGEDQWGGKITTHELQDEGVDYEVHRKEILTKLSLLLARRNNIKLEAMHRSIFEDGNMQGLSNSHCFSCHIVSEELPLENRTHEVQAGIQSDVSEKVTVGYQFGYRSFKSNAPEAMAYYDPAKHPVSGGSAEEFASRVLFADSNLVYNQLPETQKMSHKVRTRARLGETGRLNASVGYSSAENRNVDLKTKSITGATRYSATVASNTRLIVRAAGAKIEADDPFIDIRDFREGRPSGPVTSFDYIRYSTLDRTQVDVSAEFIHRATRGLTLSWLNGVKVVDRKDYPLPDDGIRSKTFSTQAKVRFNKMRTVSGWLKYRFEKTVDPFVSGRGLFEARGREQLAIAIPEGEGASVHRFIYYYQREALRYQDITTDPNDRHEVEASATFHTSNTSSVNLSLRGWHQSTSDLDSLDVRSWQVRPNVMLALNPAPSWMFTAGYSMYMGKSRGPITVALFDG